MRSRALNLAKNGFACAIFTLGSLAANAQDVGGVNFGAAGPSSWGILTLGGSGEAGFGNAGTDLSINGPGAGVYGSVLNSNIGIGGTGQAAGWGGATPQPTIDGTLYYTSSNTGINTSGVTINGGIVLNNSLLTSAAIAAAAGLAAANALSCNMGAVCGSTLNLGGNVSMTINPMNPGQNVLIVSSINLGNGANLTLGGPAGTNWVIIDTGGLTLNSGTISLASGLTPANDLIVVDGNASSSGGLNNESVINGVLVVPTGTAHFSPGMINGELIAGGSTVTFVSGGSVNTGPSVPEGASSAGMLLIAFAVCGIALKFSLRSRQRTVV